MNFMSEKITYWCKKKKIIKQNKYISLICFLQAPDMSRIVLKFLEVWLDSLCNHFKLTRKLEFFRPALDISDCAPHQYVQYRNVLKSLYPQKKKIKITFAIYQVPASCILSGLQW